MREAFAGDSAYDARFVIGPTVEYYEQLVAEEQQAAVEGRAISFGKSVSVLVQRFLAALPVEVPFGDAGGTSPRNNTSMITLLQLDGEKFLCRPTTRTSRARRGAGSSQPLRAHYADCRPTTSTSCRFTDPTRRPTSKTPSPR